MQSEQTVCGKRHGLAALSEEIKEKKEKDAKKSRHPSVDKSAYNLHPSLGDTAIVADWVTMCKR